MPSQKILTALETLDKISVEIGRRFERWDDAIENKQQVVAIQDLDFWKSMIAGAVKVLRENLGELSLLKANMDNAIIPKSENLSQTCHKAVTTPTQTCHNQTL